MGTDGLQTANERNGVICRYCKREIEPGRADKVRSYWLGHSEWAHLECCIAGFRDEVIECQTIDADCNDCRHFERGQLVKRMLSCMEDGKASMREVNMGIINGHCRRFDKPTVAQPNKWTGHECFEHRRASA